MKLRLQLTIQKKMATVNLTIMLCNLKLVAFFYNCFYKPTAPIFYCSQSVLVFYSRPLENNRKWVWYVYKQHNNLVVGLVFEIQEIQTSALIILAIMLNLVQ